MRTSFLSISIITFILVITTATSYYTTITADNGNMMFVKVNEYNAVEFSNMVKNSDSEIIGKTLGIKIKGDICDVSKSVKDLLLTETSKSSTDTVGDEINTKGFYLIKIRGSKLYSSALEREGSESDSYCGADKLYFYVEIYEYNHKNLIKHELRKISSINGNVIDTYTFSGEQRTGHSMDVNFNEPCGSSYDLFNCNPISICESFLDDYEKTFYYCPQGTVCTKAFDSQFNFVPTCEAVDESKRDSSISPNTPVDTEGPVCKKSGSKDADYCYKLEGGGTTENYGEYCGEDCTSWWGSYCAGGWVYYYCDVGAPCVVEATDDNPNAQCCPADYPIYDYNTGKCCPYNNRYTVYNPNSGYCE